MNKLYKDISPNILFITSIVCLPAVFFLQSALYIWIICFLFMLLLLIKNKKLKVFPSLIIFLSIVFFNLLTPSGRVLLNISSFTVTEGALFSGIEKAGVLLSMVFISQYALSKNLHIKGVIGFFINNMFHYFERLIEHKSKFSIKKPFDSIDAILIEVYSDDTKYKESSTKRIKKQGIGLWLVCIFPLAICYTLLFFSYV